MPVKVESNIGSNYRQTEIAYMPSLYYVLTNHEANLFFFLINVKRMVLLKISSVLHTNLQ